MTRVSPFPVIFRRRYPCSSFLISPGMSMSMWWIRSGRCPTRRINRWISITVITPRSMRCRMSPPCIRSCTGVGCCTSICPFSIPCGRIWRGVRWCLGNRGWVCSSLGTGFGFIIGSRYIWFIVWIGVSSTSFVVGTSMSRWSMSMSRRVSIMCKVMGRVFFRLFPFTPCFILGGRFIYSRTFTRRYGISFPFVIPSIVRIRTSIRGWVLPMTMIGWIKFSSCTFFTRYRMRFARSGRRIISRRRVLVLAMVGWICARRTVG